MRGNDPKSPTLLRPSFCFPQKPDKSTDVTVGQSGLGSYKSLARFVIDVNIIISIRDSHIRRTRPSAGRSLDVPAKDLLAHLPAPTPDNNKPYHYS